MILERITEKTILQKLTPGKVVVLLGARRVGKTFLLKKILTSVKEKYIFWSGEDFAVHEILKRRSVQNYKNIIADNTLLVIDEAQKIPDIGSILKLIVDSFANLKIIVSGSSAFDITNLTGEPLTGRKHQILIFPFAEKEYSQIEKPEEQFDNMKERLVYGNMPELINLYNKNEKEEYLRELINSYLLKDILTFEKIKKSSKIFNLLKLIAYQVGNEVSLQELGSRLSMSKNTVERYLDVLSKVFVIYKLTGFSKNLRKEIVKNSKWYFIDNGIRNAIIANFQPLELRNDVGSLWENYMISERIKKQTYDGMIVNNYFWRTYDQQEIDFVEEREGKLFAYEFKWKEQKVKLPAAWKNAYPDSKFGIISQENYFEWLS
ncbi:MAG: ATP-binding protein [Ignavibacteriales bacterium]|nr:ATP-binding protein [Ignavibacteriales bacterium]